MLAGSRLEARSAVLDAVVEIRVSDRVSEEQLRRVVRRVVRLRERAGQQGPVEFRVGGGLSVSVLRGYRLAAPDALDEPDETFVGVFDRSGRLTFPQPAVWRLYPSLDQHNRPLVGGYPFMGQVEAARESLAVAYGALHGIGEHAGVLPVRVRWDELGRRAAIVRERLATGAFAGLLDELTRIEVEWRRRLARWLPVNAGPEAFQAGLRPALAAWLPVNADPEAFVAGLRMGQVRSALAAAGDLSAELADDVTAYEAVIANLVQFVPTVDSRITVRPITGGWNMYPTRRGSSLDVSTVVPLPGQYHLIVEGDLQQPRPDGQGVYYPALELLDGLPGNVGRLAVLDWRPDAPVTPEEVDRVATRRGALHLDEEQRPVGPVGPVAIHPGRLTEQMSEGWFAGAELGLSRFNPYYVARVDAQGAETFATLRDRYWFYPTNRSSPGLLRRPYGLTARVGGVTDGVYRYNAFDHLVVEEVEVGGALVLWFRTRVLPLGVTGPELDPSRPAPPGARLVVVGMRFLPVPNGLISAVQPRPELDEMDDLQIEAMLDAALAGSARHVVVHGRSLGAVADALPTAPEWVDAVADGLGVADVETWAAVVRDLERITAMVGRGDPPTEVVAGWRIAVEELTGSHGWPRHRGTDAREAMVRELEQEGLRPAHGPEGWTWIGMWGAWWSSAVGWPGCGKTTSGPGPGRIRATGWWRRSGPRCAAAVDEFQAGLEWFDRERVRIRRSFLRVGTRGGGPVRDGSTGGAAAFVDGVGVGPERMLEDERRVFSRYLRQALALRPGPDQVIVVPQRNDPQHLYRVADMGAQYLPANTEIVLYGDFATDRADRASTRVLPRTRLLPEVAGRQVADLSDRSVVVATGRCCRTDRS